MEILLNGEKKSIPEGLNLSGLIEFLQLRPQQLAIELNFQIVKSNRWNEVYLSRGDKIEIVHFVGGGLCSMSL
jgi:thiamine biosynthesis protein ThiS